MRKNYKNTTIAITFIWIGFIGAISFMEAWLKFQAPGVTTEIGLSVGKLVFNALNKVEITFGLLLLFTSVKETKNRQTRLIFLSIPLFILIAQTLWLLPALDQRAQFIIQGADVPKSRLHLWYVVLEMIKVTSLIIFGIKHLKISTNENR
ncbi:hypothetical protein M0D21_06245 [Aquimarina sp. D1M17]|uniref:hypothetical protein n=1 Tax=Aquimarina acroporae TaxID=2937283 RepID=UPI0020C14BA6|nr:hypothetical protein [Aquimarina acroporae]MCK8521157.1 hypothetical protein [Aquimarina acroporae]